MNKRIHKIKSYLKKRKNRVSVFGLGIGFDWKFILFIRTTMIIVGLVGSIILYHSISTGRIFEGSAPVEETEDSVKKKADIERAVQSL